MDTAVAGQKRDGAGHVAGDSTGRRGPTTAVGGWTGDGGGRRGPFGGRRGGPRRRWEAWWREVRACNGELREEGREGPAMETRAEM